MEFDLANQPEIVQQAAGYALQGWDLAMSWLLSPEAWSQFALLLVAWFAARYANKKLQPLLQRWLTPPEGHLGFLTKARLFVLQFLPLLLPLLAYGFTGIGESVVRSIFDSGAVIAFGKRLFLFLAVRTLVRDIIADPLFKMLGKYVLVPVAGLYVLGLLDLVQAKLADTVVPLGNLSFSVLSLVQFVIVGGIIFWFGRWSKDQSAALIHKQEDMRPATRQLAEKAAEIAIFGVAFLVFMNIMGIPLTSLAVLTGALGVGIGFGLQKIASNFISGVILLLEGQATVGDYVELDGGEAGTIIKMTARAAILESFDGRWIVVPNEDFIVTRVVNYSDQGSANRYEAPFSVSYDTDINLVPDIIEKAVSTHPRVLDEPYPADCELRGFGDSGIDFAVEFWVNGLDDGPNKFTSDVLFLIWNALKDNGIEIPYPHRVIEVKGDLGALAPAAKPERARPKKPKAVTRKV
ncbi:mechanosensitive ion channel [Marinovum sp. 2_MG-2023]|uniref:mechanosensitive ion channel family protein n=1 Tax=unclassified Marinovum TaxID=2647166 RepID=UPI0026E303FD|nr:MULTISPECIES: mechanosensitive ion channel domain-containing protein [unclassified Marinovum]MDO6730289.1 mechanosensitive ion channel [Marinovum sp. 2_MG-2023]MDO6779027.1 mechanosensitive ion channel [Marinovum sp. 1_MG-2023]